MPQKCLELTIKNGLNDISIYIYEILGKYNEALSISMNQIEKIYTKAKNIIINKDDFELDIDTRANLKDEQKSRDGASPLRASAQGRGSARKDTNPKEQLTEVVWTPDEGIEPRGHILARMLALGDGLLEVCQRLEQEAHNHDGHANPGRDAGRHPVEQPEEHGAGLQRVEDATNQPQPIFGREGHLRAALELGGEDLAVVLALHLAQNQVAGEPQAV